MRLQQLRVNKRSSILVFFCFERLNIHNLIFWFGLVAEPSGSLRISRTEFGAASAAAAANSSGRYYDCGGVPSIRLDRGARQNGTPAQQHPVILRPDSHVFALAGLSPPEQLRRLGERQSAGMLRCGQRFIHYEPHGRHE